MFCSCVNKKFYQNKVKITLKKSKKFGRMIKSSDDLAEVNHQPISHYIPDHPYQVLIIGDSRLGKTSVLLNLI